MAKKERTGIRLKKLARNMKTEYIGIRMTEAEINEVKLKANIYTEGNVSQWMLYCALNYKPSSRELIEEIPRIQARREKNAI